MNYFQLKRGTILKHQNREAQIRFIFLGVNPNSTIKLIAIKAKYLTGVEWNTDLKNLFEVAEDKEQFVFKWNRFDLDRYIKILQLRLCQ